MKTIDSPTIVALFVRVPVPGRVKTRLAADLGADEACSLYRAMVTDILYVIRTSGFPVYLFHDGGENGELPEEWLQAASGVVAQRGGDIGERMAAAFEGCFSGNISQVVLVGSDIPALDAPILTAAAAALEVDDVAIAPAVDGGYCLIAMKRETYDAGLFRGIPWSTDGVLRATLEICATSGLQVSLLRSLRDIDTIEDLKEYCRAPSGHATETNGYLETVGLIRPHV